MTSFPQTLSTMLLLLVCVASCGEKEAPKEKPIPGINNARPYLYPYDFSEHGTVQGTRILENYLAQKPNAPDSRLAVWLLNRTYLDMLTRVVTLMVDDRADEAKRIQRMIAREIGLEEDANLPTLAARIHKRLATIVGDDAIADESYAAIRILDALANLQDPAYFGSQLDAVAQEPDIELATNARLLIAARTMGLFNHLRSVPIDNALSYMVTQYPFPCPEGFVAFSQGDRSLTACGFACSELKGDLSSFPPDQRRAALARACGASYYGFSPDRDGEDIRYLSTENFILVRILLHMTENQRTLSLQGHKTAIGALHKSFIKSYASFITNLSLPSYIPLMGPTDAGLMLPSLTTLREPPPGIPLNVAIRRDEVRLNIANHFRVHRGQITIPEHILGYTFPGRLGTTFTAPFTLDPAKIVPEGDLSRGLLTAIVPILRDCSQDRERLLTHQGSVIPGRSDPADPFGLKDELHASTQILADRDTPLRLLRILLRTLDQSDFRPYELIVWDPRRQRAGTVAFDVVSKPPQDGELVALVTASGWTLRRQDRALARSTSSRFDDALVELYTTLQHQPEPRPLYISLNWNGNLSATQLAQLLEVLSYDRGSAGAQATLQDLLRQPAKHKPDHAKPSVFLILGT